MPITKKVPTTQGPGDGMQERGTIEAVEDRAQKLVSRGPAVHEVVAGGRLLPRVGDDDPEGGQGRADSHQQADSQ